MNRIEIIECGWPGHFCDAMKCLYRRNTHISYGETHIVISTVGNYLVDQRIEKVTTEAYYETMAFYGDDSKYHDANVDLPIIINSPHTIYDTDKDIEANIMHNKIVHEICDLLQKNEL